MRKFDKEWNNFVLSNLEEDEKKDGYPTCQGLMRVCEKVYGKILSATTDVLKFPTSDDKSTTVIAHIQCLEYQLDEEGEPIYDIEEGVPVTYSGAADTFKIYLKEPFDQHLVSSVETRALGRAIKKVLCLKGLTHEEANYNHTTHEEPDDMQASVVLNMISRLGVNPEKFLAKFAGIDLDGLNTISKEVMENLIDKLNGFQSSSVPKEFQAKEKEVEKDGSTSKSGS